METTTINTNEVKKELYRSKVMAKFSHYTAGNIYYTVELSDGTYQLPMSTTDKGILTNIENIVKDKLRTLETIEPTSDDNEKSLKEEIDSIKGELTKMLSLSSDLGATTFCAEIKGSDLNRWIAKAIAKNDFIKIS